MWKRWSIKSFGGETRIETKAKQQVSSAMEPSDPVSLGNKPKDPNTNDTIQETVSNPQEQTDKVAEAIPTQLSSPQKSADDTIKQSTIPVSSTETSAAEILGSVPSDTCVPREVTTSPFTIPHTDSAEPHSLTSKPPSVKAGDVLPVTPRNVDHTPTFANTLSAPSPESSNLPTQGRRLSFRSLAFFYGSDKQLPLSPKSHMQEHLKPNMQMHTKFSRAQKEALLSAITLRTLMIGPCSLPSPTATSIIPLRKSFSLYSRSAASLSSPNLKKVKTQLLKSESANAIISHLRRLPLPDGPSFHVSGRASSDSFVTHPDTGGAPIHAVCLACTDEEAEEKHFSRLSTGHNVRLPSSLTPNVLSTDSSSGSPNVASASLESLIPVLRDLHLVSLLSSPDLGFGQPVNDEGDTGVFTGSVPSPATLVEGFEEITTQLMNLGFATSRAVAPSHAGIYPPKDRISILTYWWGLELVLPEPSVVYLGKVKSISNTLLNFLSALALFSNGVREALPFIRYIANFVDFEWSSIKAQDKGQGVICAATWIMPAAMVPRPWDFPSRPKTSPTSPPSASTSPSAPKTSADNEDEPTEGAKAPTQPPPEHSGSPDIVYPVAPALPMMPQLMVTPATLPRNTSVPPQTGV